MLSITIVFTAIDTSVAFFSLDCRAANQRKAAMIISIVNRSKSIADEELQGVIRAINRQIAEDFEPYWSFGATLRLEGKIGREADTKSLPELRGDAVIYLWDKTD